jgi:hypothetical protein
MSDYWNDAVKCMNNDELIMSGLSYIIDYLMRAHEVREEEGCVLRDELSNMREVWSECACSFSVELVKVILKTLRKHGYIHTDDLRLDVEKTGRLILKTINERGGACEKELSQAIADNIQSLIKREDKVGKVPYSQEYEDALWNQCLTMDLGKGEPNKGRRE